MLSIDYLLLTKINRRSQEKINDIFVFFKIFIYFRSHELVNNYWICTGEFYADYAQVLIKEARGLYIDDNQFKLDIEEMAYTLYSSTIDNLSLFEKVSINELVTIKNYTFNSQGDPNQLILLDF